MFDKRGVGLSDPVALAAPLTVESWTEDLSAVLDAVGSQRAAVAASDMAGFIGVLFSATHPDRTTALVLVNATARVRRAPDYPIGLPDHLAERLVAAYDDGWGAAAPTLGIMDPSVADNEGYLAWVSRYQRATASPGTIGPMVRMVVDTDVPRCCPLSGCRPWCSTEQMMPTCTQIMAATSRTTFQGLGTWSCPVRTTPQSSVTPTPSSPRCSPS